MDVKYDLTVVLVRPETPGNIGAVARAMKNFGFKNLVLVDPCEIEDEAEHRAKHAKDVLGGAKTVDRIDWDRYDLVVSTSSETGGGYNVLRNAITPVALRDKLQGVEGKVALVFGPESKGLRNDEIAEADFLCHIPANGEYPVFNLSHAVAILLYELSGSHGSETYKLAGKDQKRVLMENLDSIVEGVDIEDYRRGPLGLSLKNIFGRAMISSREANTVIGFLRKIKENLG